MLETLILSALTHKTQTIYGIRKYIIDVFGIYTKPSLGAIHPAIQRLVKNEFIVVTKRFSDGGQKTLFHQLTSKGKEHFEQLFSEINSKTLPKINSEIMMKIIMLNQIDNNDIKENFFKSAMRAIDLASFDVKNFLTNNSNPLVETSASITLKEFSDLKYHLELLKKEV